MWGKQWVMELHWRMSWWAANSGHIECSCYTTWQDRCRVTTITSPEKVKYNFQNTQLLLFTLIWNPIDFISTALKWNTRQACSVRTVTCWAQVQASCTSRTIYVVLYESQCDITTPMGCFLQNDLPYLIERIHFPTGHAPSVRLRGKTRGNTAAFTTETTELKLWIGGSWIPKGSLQRTTGTGVHGHWHVARNQVSWHSYEPGFYSVKIHNAKPKRCVSSSMHSELTLLQL